MERKPINSEFPYIPEYSGQIKYFGKENIPIHIDKSSRKFKDVSRHVEEIPVYSVWNYANHSEIAKRISSGEVALLYMWGTYGVAMLIDSPEWQKEGVDEAELFSIGSPS